MEVLSPRPTGGGQKTLFVTFYSFKGGVGRTLALLNVACILAGLGRRVLMIDFDLEAPGLTHFQDKQIEEGFSRQQPGLVDAIDDFLEDPWSSPLGDADPEIFFDNYVSSLNVPEGVQKGEKDGVLDLVPAGRLDDAYEGRMYDLNFEEMFEEGVGRPLFERMKDVIEGSGRYDYILIDSRTGFSDEGSICTRFLADYLMVLTGLNRQNVRGTARFLRQANVAERDETLALVASPVPMYYEKLRAERIETAKEHISERAGLDEVRFVSQIPYHPVLALEEDPTVRSLEGTDLFESYEEITERLRTWAGDRPEERIEHVIDLLSSGKTKEALAVFRDVRYENPEVALQFLRRSDRFLAEKYLDSVVDIFEEGVSTAETVGDLSTKRSLLASLATAYADRGKNTKSITLRERALGVSRDLDDTYGTTIDLFKLGIRHHHRGDLEKAIDHYRKAISLLQELDNQSDEAVVLNSLGIALSDQGDTERAIKRYEQALELYQKVGNVSGRAAVHNNMGDLYSERGNSDRAIEHLERALELNRKAENRRGEAIALANLGIERVRVEGGEGEERALTDLERASEISDDLDRTKLRASIFLDRARALAHVDMEQALESLGNDWDFIQKYAKAFERIKAHVLRARLRLEVEHDAEGAAEDAQKALTFYRERDVDSRWSREAEEILEKTQAHDAS